MLVNLKILLILLFNLICEIPQSAAFYPNPKEARTKELYNQLRNYKRDYKKLQSLKAKQAVYDEKLNKYPLGSESFLKKQNVRVIESKQINESLLKERRCQKDSNYLKNQIEIYQIKCKNLLNEIEQKQSEIKDRTKGVMSGRDFLLNGNASDFKSNIKKQKKYYYLTEKFTNQKRELLDKINVRSASQILNTAQQNQNKLLAQLNQPNFKLPSGYQTKSALKNQINGQSIPANGNKMDEIKSKAKEFNHFLDSQNKILEKDSLWFKPNPYKSLSLKDRLKPTFSWQTLPGSNLTPNQIQTFFGVKFLLTPILTPIVTVSNNLGLGYGFDKLKITNEALGIQVGLQSKVYKRLYIQANFESNILIAKSESVYTYKYNPGLIVGMGLNGKPGFFIGLNLLGTNLNNVQFSSIITRITF